MLDWLDKRLFIREVLMQPSLPRGRASWQYFPGFMTFLLLLFQFFTGILLYISFSFTTDFVANSFLYKLHYATGKLLVLFATAHLLRNFLVGSYHNLREIHWILLTTIVLFIWLNYFLGSLLDPGIDRKTLELVWFVSIKNNTISNDQLKNIFAVHTTIIPVIIYTLYLMYFYLLKKTGLESRNED